MRTPSTRTTSRLVAAAATLTLGLTACGWESPVEVEAQGMQDAPAPAPARPGEPEGSATPVDPGSTPTPEPEPTTDPEPEPTNDPATAPAPTSTPEPERSETPERSEPSERSETQERSETSAEQEPEEPRVLAPGDQGPAVQRVQQRLVDLGYWLGTADGVYGSLTEQAVLAFQGWEGLTRDGLVGPATRGALADAARPVPAGDGDLVEVHRDQQVLLVVRDGRTRWAVHVSSGSGEQYTLPSGAPRVADTPAGRWSVSWQVDGWRESSLGRLWRPKYFHEDGLAIHGFPEVPAYPASHGCVRVSMDAMNAIWANGWVPEGSTVVVH